jgi:hypothetical protein
VQAVSVDLVLQQAMDLPSDSPRDVDVDVGQYLGHPESCEYKTLTQEDTITIQVSFSTRTFSHGEVFGILMIAQLGINPSISHCLVNIC